MTFASIPTKISQRETIAAIATAAGAGGVGIVRISGAGAEAMAEQFLRRRPRPRYAHFARFCNAGGVEIDHGLMLFFAAPNSFTGEDVLEIQVHGSPVALQMLLQRCYQLGARPARAGEFSERAFLNQKMDLAQAEAVADLIAAQSQAAATAAVRSLAGVFSQRVDHVLRDLITLRSFVEALIDFPEEEIDFSHQKEVLDRLSALRVALHDLLAGARAGQRLRDGLYIVIVGPPNAGKSSLLNALCQTDSAIVTAIPGTTRDVLRESIQIDGIPITLVDTAGLRISQDAVEAEGIRRAQLETQRADLVLLLIGADQLESFADLASQLPSSVQNVPRLHVRSKSDLLPSGEDPTADVAISTQSATGLEDLKRAILQHAIGSQGEKREGSEGSFSARARHVHALETVLQHLDAAGELFTHASSDLSAEELRLAQLDLSSITGAFSADDLLGSIFSSFCIGK